MYKYELLGNIYACVCVDTHLFCDHYAVVARAQARISKSSILPIDSDCKGVYSGSNE